MKRRRPAPPVPRSSVRARLSPDLAAGCALFVAALCVRLLFWRATADADWAHSAFYKGDALVWLEYARSLRAGVPFELGLPIHPPGAGYLVAALFDGRETGLSFLRFAWAALGALLPALVFAATRSAFGVPVAFAAGLLCTGSTGLLLLSASVGNETPYLVLALLGLWLGETLRVRPALFRLALFSLVNALACLFRVEHVLFFACALSLLALAWSRPEQATGPRSWKPAVVAVFVSVFCFAATLAPWHLQAWARIREFNTVPRTLLAGEERAIRGVEEATAFLPWDEAARREALELPAFLRRTATAFVTATVAHRGGVAIGAPELGILEEAFGYRPKPLAAHPFVSSYGPLNFYLANRRGAPGGFDPSPLDAPPSLLGGAARYPEFLVQGLPPRELAFVYPPHLKLFNEGYRLGVADIRTAPAAFFRLVLRKLRIVAEGASLGFTGFGLPAGLSGVRRAVDLTTPERGAAHSLWLLCWLGAATVGLGVVHRRPAAWPFIAFLASKLIVAVAFFGYARLGATLVPVLALFVAAATVRFLPGLRALGPARGRALAVGALLALVAVEAARLARRPVIEIDGVAVSTSDPVPPQDHAAHRISVR